MSVIICSYFIYSKQINCIFALNVNFMAHIEIKPDYTKNPKCHFCKKNDAVEGVETTRKCFYFEKVFHLTGVYHKYTYKMVDVLVPSCKE